MDMLVMAELAIVDRMRSLEHQEAHPETELKGASELERNRGSTMKKLPHRNELMSPTVEAIKALGGSASVEEIVEKVITLVGIPDELVNQPYVGKRGKQDSRTQLEYELAWARTVLKQLGILENS